MRSVWLSHAGWSVLHCFLSALLVQVTTKTSPPAANSVNGDPRGSGSIMSNCGGSSNGSVNGGDPTGPVRVAVLFAGRQASGGHNIIWGLHEYLKGTGSTVRETAGRTRGEGDPAVCCLGGGL